MAIDEANYIQEFQLYYINCLNNTLVRVKYPGYSSVPSTYLVYDPSGDFSLFDSKLKFTFNNDTTNSLTITKTGFNKVLTPTTTNWQENDIVGQFQRSQYPSYYFCNTHSIIFEERVRHIFNMLGVGVRQLQRSNATSTE